MFFHLFQNHRRYYAYDVNSNQIAEVSEHLYRLLKKNKIEKNYELSTLYENGFFKDFLLKELDNPFCERIQYLNDRNLSFFIFQVTQGCNLRCAYCPYSQTNDKIRHHSNVDMTWPVAKKALDYYFEHSVDSNFIGIGFYGGEPFVNFKLIKQIVEYSQIIFEGKDIHYSITTNGTLLTEKAIQFLDDNNFHLLISLDGNKEATDKNRKFAYNEKISVFEIVIKKINYIYTYHKKLFDNLTINMVLDPSLTMEMYDSLLNSYPFIKEANLYTVKEDDTYADTKKDVSSSFIDSYNYKIFGSASVDVGKNI